MIIAVMFKEKMFYGIIITLISHFLVSAGEVMGYLAIRYERSSVNSKCVPRLFLAARASEIEVIY